MKLTPPAPSGRLRAFEQLTKADKASSFHAVLHCNNRYHHPQRVKITKGQPTLVSNWRSLFTNNRVITAALATPLLISGISWGLSLTWHYSGIIVFGICACINWLIQENKMHNREIIATYSKLLQKEFGRRIIPDLYIKYLKENYSKGKALTPHSIKQTLEYARGLGNKTQPRKGLLALPSDCMKLVLEYLDDPYRISLELSGCLTVNHKLHADQTVTDVMVENWYRSGHLNPAANLKDISFSGADITTESLCLILKSGALRSVRKLNLSNQNLGARGAIILAKALRWMPELRYLNFSRNSINQEGAEALSGALECAPKLEWLNLGGNRICNGYPALAHKLKHTPQLRHLDLSHNAIPREGASVLAEGLTYVPKLEFLEVGGNFFYNEGAITLLKALKNTPNLNHLGLRENYITTSGFRELSNTLKHLPQLIHLDISNNLPQGHATEAINAFLDLDNPESVTANLNILNLSENSLSPHTSANLRTHFGHVASLNLANTNDPSA